MDYEKTILTNEFIAMEYTCLDYQSEMKLLGLKKGLKEEDLTEEERNQIVQEIEELEKAMKMN